MIIGTFNLQNKYNLIHSKKHNDELNEFIKFVVDNEVDVLGTQEITFKKAKKISKKLKEYKIIGDGRIKRLGRIFPFSLANETNIIITRLEPEKSETIFLPWKGSQFPRIITKCIIGDIVFLNTHLDYLNQSIMEAQLDKVYDVVEKEIKSKNKVILTGDFNMTLENNCFKKFIKKLNELNLNRVEANDNSHIRIKKGPIDHIFVSNNFIIEEIKKINLPISDHYPIVVKILDK